MSLLKLLRPLSTTSAHPSPTQIFSADTFYIWFQYESVSDKKKLRKLVTDNGGEVSIILNTKCTIVVASEEGDEFSSRLDLAFRLNIPVVVPRYILDCVSKRVRLDPEKYLLLHIVAQKAFTLGKIMVMPQTRLQPQRHNPATEPLPYSDSNAQEFELLKATILKDDRGNWFSAELQFQKPCSYSIVTHNFPKDQCCSQLTFSKAEAQEIFSRHVKSKSAAMSCVWDDFPAELGSPSLQQWRVYTGDVEPSVLQLVDWLWNEAVGSIPDLFAPNSLPPSYQQTTLAQAILEEMKLSDKKKESLSEEFHKVLQLKEKLPLETSQDILELITIGRVLREGLFVNEGVNPDHPTSKYFALRCWIQPVDCHLVSDLLPPLEEGMVIHNLYHLQKDVEHLRFRDEGTSCLLLHGADPLCLIVLLSHGLLPHHLLHSQLRPALENTKPSELRGTRFIVVCKVSLEDSSQTQHDDGCIIATDPTRVMLQYLVEFSLPEDTVVPLPPVISVKPWPIRHLLDQVEPENPGTLPTSPSLGLFSKSGGAAIPLKGFHIRAELIDLAARVNLFQEFFNPSGACEAKFVFPLEAGATVCGFEVYINNKHIVGRVKEKMEAHKEYYTAVKQGHGGYLFDQESADLFSVSLGNLPSHATVLVKIVYVLELPVEEGLIRFSVPCPSGVEHPSLQLDVTQEVTPTSRVEVGRPGEMDFSVQVALEDMYEVIQRISSPTHPIKVKKTQTKAVVELAPEARFSPVEFTLLVQLARLHVPRMWVEASPSSRGYKACMLTFYPEFSSLDLAPKADVVLLLDVSNSMQGKPHQLMLKAAEHFLESLDTHFHFNILAYGTVFQECFPTLVPASSKHLDLARKFVASLEPRWGTTSLERPLHYLSHINSASLNVLLLTDGFLSAPQTLLQGLSPGLRLFILGLGDRVDGPLLQKLAIKGSGSFEKVTDPGSIPKKVEVQLQRCRQPTLTNVSIVWEEDGSREAIKMAPSIIPTIYSGQRVVIYSFIHQAVMATLKGTIEGRTYETTFYSSPLHETKGTVLHTLAAKAVLDDWLAGSAWPLDTVESQVQLRQAKDSIIKLCLDYNLVSPLTSFVAIENRDTKPSNTRCPVQDILKSASVDHLQYLTAEQQDDTQDDTCPAADPVAKKAYRSSPKIADIPDSHFQSETAALSEELFDLCETEDFSSLPFHHINTIDGPPPASFGAPAAISSAHASSFGAPAATSSAYAASFGAPAATSIPHTASFGATAAKSIAHAASFGAPAATSIPYAASFGAPAAKSIAYAASFGAPAATSSTYAASSRAPAMVPCYFSAAFGSAPAFETASETLASNSALFGGSAAPRPPPANLFGAFLPGPGSTSADSALRSQDSQGFNEEFACEALQITSAKMRRKYKMAQRSESISEVEVDAGEREKNSKWPQVSKSFQHFLKVVDKQTLESYLIGHLGQFGGIPLCQKVLKLDCDKVDYSIPEMPNIEIFFDIIHAKGGNEWLPICIEMNVIDPSVVQVLQDHGIRSLGQKSVQKALQLIGGVAFYLHLLAAWLAYVPASPLPRSLEFLATMLGGQTFADCAAAARNLPSSRTLDLGPNWELAVLPFLRL